MEITIQPHKWEDCTGKHSAECYPFVDGKPSPELASCGMCAKYQGDRTCKQWEGKEDEAPLFCGPICHKFSVV